MIRSISKLTPAIALILGTAGTVSAAEFAHDEPMEQISQWTGTYEGYNDGRRARLTIEHVRTTNNSHIYSLTLKDLDRNTTLEGRGRAYIRDGHIMKIGTLESVDGSVEKNVERLLLHTWDTDHISGYTDWKGTDYGLSFSQ